MIQNKIKTIIQNKILFKPKTLNYYHAIDNAGSWIFDFRKGFMDAEILSEFSSFFWEKYGEYYPFQVGGIESGSIPFIAGIALEGLKRGKLVNTFYVRKTRKEKGLGNMIEGNLGNEKIIIVDDVLNGGQSLFAVIKSLDSVNRTIFKSFVFVNFGNPSGQSVARENSIDLECLFTLSDFGLSDSLIGGLSSVPIIYPKFKKLFQAPNQNFFLDTPKSNPLLIGNALFFGGECGDFFCINKDTGDIIWRTVLPKTPGHKNILSSPIVARDTIILGNYDGNIYSLDISSGEILHVFESGADFIGSSGAYDHSRDILYIGGEHACATNKGSLIAFDNIKKIVIWEKYFTDFVHASPAFLQGKNLIICGGNDGKLICVHGDTSEVVFQLNINAPIKGSFVFSGCGEYVFFGTHDFCFYKVNINSGVIIDKLRTNNIIYTRPLLVADDIFFGSLDKNFYHIKVHSGEVAQIIKTTGKIFGEPLLIEDKIVCFTSNDGCVYFYDFNNKKIVYSIFHGEKINNKVIYEREYGYLYILDHVGGVYKYNVKPYIS